MKRETEKLNFLINQGEGYNIEFKESFSNNISREICAFSNANGGKILLGITDDGKIKGIEITNNLKSKIEDIARNLNPSLNINIYNIDDVLIIDIPEGISKPYSTNGRFFLRYGTNSQQLKRDEIREFFQKEGLILFDEKPNYDFNFDEDFNEEKFKFFLEKARISYLLKKEEILENLELIKENHLKNVGVLLFCKRVTRFFRNATITCALFRGKDKYKILDSKEFDEDMHSNYQNALNYIQSKLNTEYIIKGGPRKEKLELPEDALREALLNAIAHRNYFSNANIQIYLFSDRVEITNPGGLVPGMTISDLGKKSMPRNFLLFGLMQRMDLVEKVGSGILRIKKAMKEYGLKNPKIEADSNWFTIIFKRPDLQKESFEIRKEETPKKTTQKTTQKIINLIQENPNITRDELAEILGITPDGVKYHFYKLKKKGILIRIGGKKGGYWRIIKDE